MDENQFIKLLGRESWDNLKNASKVAQSLEAKHRAQFERIFKELDAKCLEALAEGRSLPEIDFGWLLTVQKYRVIREALEVAESQKEFKKKTDVSLAKIPKNRMPRSLKELTFWWDEIKSRKTVGRAEKKYAEELKKNYLKKVKSVWEHVSGDFREGKDSAGKPVANQNEAKDYFKREMAATHGRANTIVNTETTRHYNQARVEFYDQSEDVTHYLFLAIRDSRTTKWCCDYHSGGRHGLVYTKGTEVFRKEMCPCHWNCRSEMVPLTMLNPNHARIINDYHRRREYHTPYPLPPGWEPSKAA